METETVIDTTDVNPSFKCEVCQKSFPKKANLGIHKRKEHGIRSRDRESNSYTCPICARVVKGYGPHVLKNHIRSHDAKALFKCELCGNSFKTVPNLKRHQVLVHREGREKYKCDICSQEFSSTTCLENHVIGTHVVDKEFQCNICQKTFLTETKLESHKKGRHAKRFYCDVCSTFTLTKKSLLKHLQRSHSRTKLCVLCRKSFPSQQEYQHHIEVDESSGKGPIVCAYPECTLVFGTSCLADQHWAEVHKSTIQASTGSASADDQETTIFECELCNDRSFKNEWDLRSHERCVHPNAEWKCRVCDKGFKQKWELNAHRRKNHITERNYKCETCLKVFKSDSALKSHVKIHIKDKPYKCTKCSKSYTTDRCLRAHLANTHKEGEKPYKCPHCPMSFFRKAALDRAHIPSHFDERPFPCEGCPKRFKTKASMLQHSRHKCRSSEPYKRKMEMKKPKKEKQKRMYNCEICFKSFNSSSNLLNHVKRHDTDKSFKCSKCDKSYIARHLLACHLANAHGEGEKRYKCPHCPKRFFNKHVLDKIHIPIHFKEKRPLFPCDGCPSKFKTSAAWTLHKQRGYCRS